MKGKMKMFNSERGFGFVTGDDGKDAYVHVSSILGGATLMAGDTIEYDVETSDRGLRAKNVKKV